MIKKDGKNIKNVYIGSKQIYRIYKNNKIIYECPNNKEAKEKDNIEEWSSDE